MIHNIVFDIGNVLAGFVWEEFYRSFGYSEEEFERLADATVRSSFWNEIDRGVLSDEELLNGFIANDPSMEKQLREVFVNVERMICKYDYAIPWIKELKAKGYGVYYISNFGRKTYKDCIKALDFLPEMDGGILSYQEKIIKPSLEIYQLLLTRYGLTAEECVFIDDLSKNVEAAREAGMKGIVFQSKMQADRELDKLAHNEK